MKTAFSIGFLPLSASVFGNGNWQLESRPVRPECIPTFTFWLCVWQQQLSTVISPSLAEALPQCKAGLLVWSSCPLGGKLHYQILCLCLATAIVNWNLAQSGLTESPLSLSGSLFGNGNCQLESCPVWLNLYGNVRQAYWSRAGAPSEENCIWIGFLPPYAYVFGYSNCQLESGSARPDCIATFTICLCVWQRQLSTGILPSLAEALPQGKAGLLVWSRCPLGGKLHYQTLCICV